MSCPTCDHTMASIGYCNGGTVYHCERCGTIKHSGPFIEPPKVYVPKLVERCREYAANENVMFDSWARGEWDRLGIAEAIGPPEALTGGEK